MFSMIAFIISWMALEPLGGQFLLANSYSLFWLFVHFVSYILMGFTVYLQAKALSYDYTKVDFKLLWGTTQSSEERRCLTHIYLDSQHVHWAQACLSVDDPHTMAIISKSCVQIAALNKKSSLQFYHFTKTAWKYKKRKTLINQGFPHKKPPVFRQKSSKYGWCSKWWSRGELNPCPKTVSRDFLRAQSGFRIPAPQRHLTDFAVW